MSYVQGTVIRVIVDFEDAQTGAPINPTEVILTIMTPDGETEERLLSLDEIIDDDVSGRFTADIDTSAQAGTWHYQFESTGETAVVGKRQITVKRKIT